MVKPRAQICKLGGLNLRFSCPSPLTCSSAMTCVRPWGACTIFCCGDLITWDGSQPGPSDKPGQKSRRRGDTSCTSCWNPVHPWAAALCRSTPTWDAHTCCRPIPSPGISHLGIQGHREAWKKVPWAKCVLWLSVCSHQSLQNQNSQAHCSTFSLNARAVKVCCLSINKGGISVSSAVYKLELSLQFLVPCLYAPVRGIQ